MSIKIIAVLAALIFGLNSNAQIVDKKITHTVKQGENLHTITRHYLGTDILWKDNWKLNPLIQNPHKLRIGQKLVIIKERTIPAQNATMIEIINKVEIKSELEQWQKAITGDKLKEYEGVKTYGSSSALLQFNDETELKILEHSQVFLNSRKITLSGTDAATIEIIKGDAELNWAPISTSNSEITVISGSASLTPTLETKRLAFRAGLTKDGGSIVSMYKGSSKIESAGTLVTIPQGMGLKVEKDKAPSKPTKLLTAPILEEIPEVFNYTNPKLKWNEISQALNYLVEICADKDCKKIMRQKTTDKLQWQISKLDKKGQYYWRVSAVSIDGIIGYKAKVKPIEFIDSRMDVAPPIIALEIIGKQRIVTGIPETSSNAKLKVFGIDSQSGIKSISYKFDKGDWLPYQGLLIDIPRISQSLLVKAIDNLDQQMVKKYVLVVD